MIVAIDGPAGSGKSTVARRLAEAEGFAHLNTGALYRAVAHLAGEGGIDPERQPERTAQIAREMVFEYDVAGGGQRFLVAAQPGAPKRDLTQALFTTALTQQLKPVVNNEAVRAALVEKMRAAARKVLAAGARGVVLEGRDIGTVVFPDAFLKIYLQADLEERTRRRAEELRARGERFEEAGLKKQIEYRDQVDASRSVGPLKRAEDAVVIDTTGMDAEATLRKLQEELGKRRRLVRPQDQPRG